MIDLKTFDCTGCTACYNVCPHNAITMLENEEGFKFPHIDLEKCTDCGLCNKVCIPSKGYTKAPFEVQAFGAKNKNLDERKQSQSGGAFFVLAKYVLAKNGVVYGSAIGEDFVVRHTRAETENEAKAFRGSKYVQSDLGDIFSLVKKDLQAGKLVLFSGTPCQVAGLKAFLIKDYDNLILMDLICHGVPSPKVWADYLTWQQKRFKKYPLTNPVFRELSCPWGKCVESFLSKNKKVTDNIFASIFYSLNAHRKCCFSCPFTNTERLSDITVGDCWGIENFNPEFKDIHGVSAVLVNSEKGKRIWEEIKDEFAYFPCTVENLVSGNPQLQRPIGKSPNREQFWADYQSGFDGIAKKYGGNDCKGKIKKLIKRILGKM